MNKTIFLTGATGLVGVNLAKQILNDENDTRLVLLVRGASDNEAYARFMKTLAFVYPDFKEADVDNRVQIVRGDITLESLGLSENSMEQLSCEVTHIIHSAANVQFHLPIERARHINVHGTENLMKFALRVKGAGKLQRVAYISTAYVSGDRNGVVHESEFDCGQRFGNSYEQSKFEAERFVRGQMAHLPITIFRPSIIVGDSRTGKTTAFNVLYAPLRMIYQGLVKFLPGSHSTPIDVVPVDYVSEAICHIFLRTNQGIGETFHLTAGKELECTTGGIVDAAVEYFNNANSDAHVGSVEFLPLAIYRSSLQFLHERMQKILLAMEQYIPYLCISRTYDSSSTNRALRGTTISLPHFNQYSRALFQFCLEADWGKRIRMAA
jgi:long-chain acyl-CoA synthetase